MKRIVLFLLVNVLCLSAISQTAEVGVFGGGSFYMGDLNPKVPFHNTKMALGGIIRYNFDQRLAVRLDGKYGKLTGDNRDFDYYSHMADSGQFNVNVLAISMIGEWNYLDYFIGSKSSWFTPYLFAGVGFHMPTLAKDQGERDNGVEHTMVQGTKAEESALKDFIFPFGFGIKLALTKRIGVNLDWTMVKTFNDDIDKQVEFTPENKQWTNGSTNDWYSFAGITLLYKFDTRKKGRCYGMDRDY